LSQPTEPRYLRTAQVAELLQVSPKTVSRWAQEGMLPYVRTLGGHRRYPDPGDPSPSGNPVRAILGRLTARLA
jgi:excisionase family DNA binding protein